MLREKNLPTAPRYAPTARSKAELEIVAENITRSEAASAEAERESRKIKLMEFFERRIGRGNAFEAIVTSLSNHGFFVELTQSQAYGFVHLRTFRDDIYRLSDDGTELRGRRTGSTFRAGDRVFVDVESVDRFKRQIDFHMADCAQPEPVRGEPQASGFKMGKVSRSGEPAVARKKSVKGGKASGKRPRRSGRRR